MKKTFKDCDTGNIYKATEKGQLLILKAKKEVTYFYKAETLHPWVDAFHTSGKIGMDNPVPYYRVLIYKNGLVQAEVNHPMLFNKSKGLCVRGFTKTKSTPFEFLNITDHIDEDLINKLIKSNGGL